MTIPEVLSLVVASVTGGGSLLGVVVWSVRQEGRIDKVDTKTDDLKELINTKIDLMNLHVCQRLDRIEKALNGSLKPHD